MSDKSGAIQYRGGDGPHVGIRDRIALLDADCK